MNNPKVKHPTRSATPLRIYRISRCYSQRDLAEAAGVDRATVIRLEAGNRPSRKTANAIANVLGISAGVLFPVTEQVDDATE